MRVRDVRINPCPLQIDYDGMTPIDDARRRCDGCGEVVTDLSALDELEARAHVARGPSCVRYVYDQAGNIVHRRHLLVAATVAAGPLLVACPGGVIGDYGDGGAPSRGTLVVSGSSFTKDCARDEDCVAVKEDAPCCAGDCPTTAINVRDRAAFDAKVAEARRDCQAGDSCPTRTCNPGYHAACLDHECVFANCPGVRCITGETDPPTDAGTDATGTDADAADQ